MFAIAHGCGTVDLISFQQLIQILRGISQSSGNLLPDAHVHQSFNAHLANLSPLALRQKPHLLHLLLLAHLLHY